LCSCRIVVAHYLHGITERLHLSRGPRGR
jgi:hypothetical protein